MIVAKGKVFCGEHATMVSPRIRGELTVTNCLIEIRDCWKAVKVCTGSPAENFNFNVHLQ